jgi:hypothetical protein
VALSSAILYLAIVAIWAVVLVPRWLRPPQASGTLQSNLAEPVDAGPREDLAGEEEDGAEGSPGHGYQVTAAGLAGPGGPTWVPERGAGRAGRDSQLSPGPGRERAGGSAGPRGAERRAGILQARRRTLTTLIVLTAGAVAIAVAHLAASWVVIPPMVMLAGFVLLLREAARIDTERARAATSQHSPGTDAGVRAQAGTPGAKIIDISARVSDQLYDQYADAEVRAVGD